jgi:hypothetical protein
MAKSVILRMVVIRIVISTRFFIKAPCGLRSARCRSCVSFLDSVYQVRLHKSRERG